MSWWRNLLVQVLPALSEWGKGELEKKATPKVVPMSRPKRPVKKVGKKVE